MPRRRRTKQPPRVALPASELESKIMAMLRGDSACAKLKGVDLVYVGSIGQEPNWFARTIPPQVTEACRRAFVTALATVRKEFDLSPSAAQRMSDLGLNGSITPKKEWSVTCV